MAALPRWFACPTHAVTVWRNGTFAYRVMRGGGQDLEKPNLAAEGDIHLEAWRAIHMGSKGQFT